MSGSESVSRSGTISTLYGSVMVAKGLIATMDIFQPNLFRWKLGRMEPEHLRILFLELMDEIWRMETQISILERQSKIRLITT